MRLTRDAVAVFRYAWKKSHLYLLAYSCYVHLSNCLLHVSTPNVVKVRYDLRRVVWYTIMSY